MSTA
jgi:hypothetical protein